MIKTLRLDDIKHLEYFLPLIDDTEGSILIDILLCRKFSSDVLTIHLPNMSLGQIAQLPNKIEEITSND